jgi:hypothetical protein
MGRVQELGQGGVKGPSIDRRHLWSLVVCHGIFIGAGDGSFRC